MGPLRRMLGRAGWLALTIMLAACRLAGNAVAAAAPPPPQLSLQAGRSADLVDSAWLAEAAEHEADPPADPGLLPEWFLRHRRAERIRLQGGRYWLLARLRHDGIETRWVFDPHNTLIERAELLLAGSDGSVQRRVGGYAEPRAYALHYGQDVVLQPGVEYLALVRLDSRYFASVPRVVFDVAAAYPRKVLRENLIVLASLGAMLALALFNLFLFVLARTRSHLHYGVQLGLSVWAWSMVFQIPTELWGWQVLPLHYLPFFLMPVAASLFCIDFLDLPRRHARLHRLHRCVIAAGVLMAPLAVFALPWAHVAASLLISAWLALMLASGIVSLRAGYRPARFFVLAFSALAVSGVIILPANLGLVPDLVDNAEVLTLLGSAVEALLQAFALADRIRLLAREKEDVAAQLGRALHVAHTDAMTGLGNRYAFEQMLQERGVAGLRPDEEDCVLVIIDVDGLKGINDRDGHERGDALIRAVGRGLDRLQADGPRCWRLGGDEFAVLALRTQQARLLERLHALERELPALGFAHAGLSHGMAPWRRGDDPAEPMREADQAMYAHKAGRKQAPGPQPARDTAVDQEPVAG